MSTFGTLLSRSAVASVIALVGAMSYIHLAQAHAYDAATNFCSAVQSGEGASQVRALAQSAQDKSAVAQFHSGVSVMFGRAQRYVCDVHFAGDHVSAKAVTQLD